MELMLTYLIGWLCLPLYYLKYPGRKFMPGSLIDIRSVDLGKGVIIRSNVWLGPKVKVGDYCYITRECRLSYVTFGKFCSIAPNVEVIPSGHNFNFFSSYIFSFQIKDKKKSKYFLEREPIFHGEVSIGNDVWIGQNVKILGGTKIGDGAVVGANSFVRGDLKPYGIYVGTPAKLIKYRFSAKKIKQLTDSKWWDKDLDEIIKIREKELAESNKPLK
jgi:virginiamycin A acetyltransferase